VLSRFDEFEVDLDGISVHCWEGGVGPGVVFLHGSGAGAATLSNFRRVLDPIAESAHVLAADLIGFGQSGLKKAKPFFDINLWVAQLQMLIDRLGQESVVVVGHSLSGAIALKAATRDPRIAAVITTGTMGAPGKGTGTRWRFPESRDAVRAAVERTFYDKSLAEHDEVRRREDVLNRPGYREYFEQMFAGDPEQYVNAAEVSPDELAAITCPVLLMHGMADASFAPADSSLVLAHSIERADVYLLSQCAHSVAHERPEEFIASVRTVLARITEKH
jgi:2-hydroxymuconate-semialdehyde hydrolase